MYCMSRLHHYSTAESDVSSKRFHLVEFGVAIPQEASTRPQFICCREATRMSAQECSHVWSEVLITTKAFRRTVPPGSHGSASKYGPARLKFIRRVGHLEKRPSDLFVPGWPSLSITPGSTVRKSACDIRWVAGLPVLSLSAIRALTLDPVFEPLCSLSNFEQTRERYWAVRESIAA